MLLQSTVLFQLFSILTFAVLTGSRTYPYTLPSPSANLAGAGTGNVAVFAGGWLQPGSHLQKSTWITVLSGNGGVAPASPNRGLSGSGRSDMFASIARDEIWFIAGIGVGTNATFDSSIDVVNVTSMVVRSPPNLATFRSTNCLTMNGRFESDEAFVVGGCTSSVANTYGCTGPGFLSSQMTRYMAGASAPDNSLALTVARSDIASATVMTNGILYTIFAGGTTQFTNGVSTINLYNHSSHAWVTGLPPYWTALPQARRRSCAVAVDPYFIIIGGTEVIPQSSIYVYNMANVSQTFPTYNLAAGRDYFSCAALGHYVYVYGASVAVELIDTRDWTVSVVEGPGVSYTDTAGAQTSYSAMFAGGSAGSATDHIEYYTCGNYILDSPFEICDSPDILCKYCNCTTGSIPCGSNPSSCCSTTTPTPTTATPTPTSPTPTSPTATPTSASPTPTSATPTLITMVPQTVSSSVASPPQPTSFAAPPASGLSISQLVIVISMLLALAE